MFGLTPAEERDVTSGPRRLRMAFLLLRFVATMKKNGATCDECMTALGLPHQSASARFHDLVRAGCLVKTGKRRRTRSGALATVHVANPAANFKGFMTRPARRRSRKAGLSELEQEVLSAGLDFVTRWKRARTLKGREEAAVALVNRLGAVVCRS